MAIPNPPKRRDRKAMLYVDELSARVLSGREAPVQNKSAAGLYATALIIVALFGDEERRLLREVYQSHTEGECLYEVRTACACDDKDQLCLILDYLMTQPKMAETMAEYMVQIIEDESWQPVQKEMEERRFTADNFVWWTFDSERW